MPEARLILAARGGWVKEEIDALLDDLALRDRVAQVFAAPDELPAYCASADVGVSIASTDATPASMIESMASRLPMVMGDAMTIDEWITPGEGGEVVDCRDEDAVTEALLKLLQDPELRRTLRRAERARRRASGSGTPASSSSLSIAGFSTIERSEAELPSPRHRLSARGHGRTASSWMARDEPADLGGRELLGRVHDLPDDEPGVHVDADRALPGGARRPRAPRRGAARRCSLASRRSSSAPGTGPGAR